ncbi:MAG: sulfotransferase [Thermodesulfobacteriota bacterium]
MKSFSLKENIKSSYKNFFRLTEKTFTADKNSQARLTPKRFFIMLLFCIVLFTVQTLHWIGYICDEIFFKGYKKVKIKEPVFILGVPRSGTTFLHRFLSEDKKNFTTISLWELVLAPSITQRKIVSILDKLDSAVGGPGKKLIHTAERKAFQGLDDIHKVSLTDPEEDYFFLAPVYACFIMIVPFPFFDELGHLAFFDDETPENDKDRIMAFYKTCLQRHLYFHGTDKILLSKNVSFSPMIEALSETFPDSKIIATVRHPEKAVPSHISSMTEGAQIFDNNISGNEFKNQMIEVQRYAYSHIQKKIPLIEEKRRLVLTMEDMQSALYSSVSLLYSHFGYTMSKDFEKFLNNEDKKQKKYKSGHNYDAKSFGLTPEDIFSIFSDVYYDYGYLPPKNSTKEKSSLKQAE